MVFFPISFWATNDDVNGPHVRNPAVSEDVNHVSFVGNPPRGFVEEFSALKDALASYRRRLPSIGI